MLDERHLAQVIEHRGADFAQVAGVAASVKNRVMLLVTVVRILRPRSQPGRSRGARHTARQVRDQLLVPCRARRPCPSQHDDLVGVADGAAAGGRRSGRCSRGGAGCRSISCSVSGSSALVASSSTSSVGLATSARAISRRWRWPPLKLRPPSSTRPSIAAGPARRSSSCIAASLAAPRRPRSSGIGRVPQRDVVAHGALEEADVLVDAARPTRRAPRAELVARGRPSSRISPDHGSYRPATSRATVDLPLPEPPTSATRLPGASREREPRTAAARRAAVAEGDVLERERAVRAGRRAAGVAGSAGSRPRSTG